MDSNAQTMEFMTGVGICCAVTFAFIGLSTLVIYFAHELSPLVAEIIKLKLRAYIDHLKGTNNAN